MPSPSRRPDLFDLLAALPTPDRIVLPAARKRRRSARHHQLLRCQLRIRETRWHCQHAGFAGSYRRTSASLSVVPVAGRTGSWSAITGTRRRPTPATSSSRRPGRKAAERTLRRLVPKIPTCEVPVVFDPEAAQEILTALFDAVSGRCHLPRFELKDRLGSGWLRCSSPWWTTGDAHAASSARPFDGEGLATGATCRQAGVLRYLGDSYSARKLGTRSTASARRETAATPAWGRWTSASRAPRRPRRSWATSSAPPRDRSHGFGLDLVSGDYSQGAFGATGR